MSFPLHTVQPQWQLIRQAGWQSRLVPDSLCALPSRREESCSNRRPSPLPVGTLKRPATQFGLGVRFRCYWFGHGAEKKPGPVGCTGPGRLFTYGSSRKVLTAQNSSLVANHRVGNHVDGSRNIYFNCLGADPIQLIYDHGKLTRRDRVLIIHVSG